MVKDDSTKKAFNSQKKLAYILREKSYLMVQKKTPLSKKMLSTRK